MTLEQGIQYGFKAYIVAHVLADPFSHLGRIARP